MCNDSYLPPLTADNITTEFPLDPEIDLARQVQQLLFPKSSPFCNWCCISVRNRMAEELGGDYFDFITMPDNCQAILIGDVTGHGMHASIVMSFIYGFIHHATQGQCAPLDLVRQVNRFLVMFGQRSRLLDHYFSSTLFFGIIDPDSLILNYGNAGHVPPLVHRAGRITELATTGQPIGFFEEPELEMASFALEKGDRLLLYTDGITEASNRRGELFGNVRLRKALRTHRGDHQEFLDLLFTTLTEFEDGVPAADDCTAIAIDFHGFWR
ncbi:MAG TPA: PP2C family protein-serine/threonine phosphatase [Geobacteraceae bacterium]|nr:PP2C family protein-serine/threonine phosphatase [Geobacteraceae bacterium]